MAGKSPEIDLRPYSVLGAYQFSYVSRAGRLFEISMWLPSIPVPSSGFPVIWVLDPHTAFATLLDTIRNQERMFGPVLVVGIGYPNPSEFKNRARDLTQGASPNDGSGALLRLITDDLRLLIARYNIDLTRQAIFGHSLGGLFVLNALFSAPTAFDTYVAGSPSIWCDAAAMHDRMSRLNGALAASPAVRRLLITIGGREATVNAEELAVALAEGISDLAERKKKNRMIERAVSLADDLIHGFPDLSTRLVRFSGETHNSVISAYIGRGARFTLAAWFPHRKSRRSAPRPQ